DPHIDRNAADSAWVGQKDWAYACKFASPGKTKSPIMLNFKGLDTITEAYLNGSHIGKFDNMYREYSVDVKDKLAPSGNDNILLVVFSSPLRFVDQVKPADNIGKHKYIRKCHSDFGSYLGSRPHSAKVGVYRDVILDMPNLAWIEGIHIQTELSSDFNKAKIYTQVKSAGANSSLKWELTDPTGNKIASGTLDESNNRFEIDVDNPKLWWIWTHGVPNLYELKVDLILDGTIVDSRSVKFGIRDIKAIFTDEETGEKRFKFQINGQPIFLRGACWAPVEGATHCWKHERAMRLLDMAQHGQMNIFRIWGEGYIPPQKFYDECDRRGILIWQDFMFGYGMHPTENPEFNDNCRIEIEEMICRLRNHPCILLWCGGNENHMGWDFGIGGMPTTGNELFQKIMPEACARLDPMRIFHPSSPFGGKVPNYPLEGDWHDYTTLTFSPDASVPLFASEVGRASAPSLSSMRLFINEDELWPKGYDPAIRIPGKPAWPPMWQYRSVDGSWDKIGSVEQFCDPSSAEELIRIIGTAHGEYLQRRVERQRRGIPDGSQDGNRCCWGNMIWRLNDSWPIIYWSVIDYYLAPKIPYYFLRRAYSSVLVSFEQTPDRIYVWIVNDSPDAVSGQLKVRRLRFDGKSFGELTTEVEIQPGISKRCLDTIDFGPISLRSEFLHASFADINATHLLIGERYLHLPHANLSANIANGKIQISTDVFVRQVTLEMDGVTGALFEDSYFDMLPSQTRTIAIINSSGGKRVNINALNADGISVDL
ncbi:MAG: beta-mannosidase, partial [Candidatus Poribacteria bacterium]|nr:beta-mannosidase [Candidatus Poribacteria bacterium]